MIRKDAWEIHSGDCVGCAWVRPFFGRAMCDRTIAHFFGTKLLENVTFYNIHSFFGTSFPVLDHLILF